MKNKGIYFIGAYEVKRVKIGFASNVKGRYSSIKSTSPCKLKLLAVIQGDMEGEKKIHRQFCKYHFIGEWFDYQGDFKKYLVDLMAFKPLDRNMMAFLEMQRRKSVEEFDHAVKTYSIKTWRPESEILSEYTELSTKLSTELSTI